jgi:pyrimidine operon attenuation protein/uracil phosphoribosyltransferase
MPTGDSVRILDAPSIDRSLTRIAHEILERNKSLDGLDLVGIRTRGVPLALRLASRLGEIGGRTPRTGVLDINLYRDDLSLIGDHPVLRKTEISFELDGSRIVLVDDVLFTGRTIRSALNGLMDLGRPDWVQLAVLVDRGHRELPIRPDYVGKNIPTARGESVEVRLHETDGEDEVLLIREPLGDHETQGAGAPS